MLSYAINLVYQETLEDGNKSKERSLLYLKVPTILHQKLAMKFMKKVSTEQKMLIFWYKCKIAQLRNT